MRIRYAPVRVEGRRDRDAMHRNDDRDASERNPRSADNRRRARARKRISRTWSKEGRRVSN